MHNTNLADGNKRPQVAIGVKKAPVAPIAQVGAHISRPNSTVSINPNLRVSEFQPGRIEHQSPNIDQSSSFPAAHVDSIIQLVGMHQAGQACGLTEAYLLAN